MGCLVRAAAIHMIVYACRAADRDLAAQLEVVRALAIDAPSPFDAGSLQFVPRGHTRRRRSVRRSCEGCDAAAGEYSTEALDALEGGIGFPHALLQRGNLHRGPFREAGPQAFLKLVSIRTREHPLQAPLESQPEPPATSCTR